MVLLLAFFVTFLGTLLAATDPPNVVQAGSNSISGYVSDDRRVPVPDLQVELLNDVDSIVQRTKTDSSGLFAFRRLGEGIYVVRVQTYGTNYVGGQTKRVQIERNRAFEQVDFVLVARQTAATNATTGAVFVQEVPAQARKEYERGAGLLQKGEQRNEGREALKKAIELFPLYFDALEMLGTDYVKQQEFEPAIPVLTKAVEVNRRSYPSLLALSVAQHYLKQLPEAIESMRRAIALNQSSSNANLWLGTLLRQTSKLDEAETYLKQADKLSASKSPEVKWQLALLFNQLKRYKEAADELELFLKIQPDAKDTELIKKLIKKFRQQSSEGVKQ